MSDNKSTKKSVSYAPFKLSAEGLAFVKKELTRYEDKKSAIIPSLFRAQKENSGWVSPAVIQHLSEVMDIPSPWIEEVATFYTMFNKEPVGRHHVQVCCNISCSMNGGRELLASLCRQYDVDENTMTKDGRFTFTRVECLGSCDTAPMMQVNEKYHENLTVEKAKQLLTEMK